MDSSIIIVDDQTVAFAHQTLMDIGALSDDGKLTALGPAIFIVSVVGGQRCRQDKIGHSSRSSSIHRSKTTEEVSGNVKQF